MTKAPNITVSIIVPVMNDDAALERLLSPPSLTDGGRNIITEILVVSASDSESTRQLCGNRNAQFIATTAGRGHQLNVGAKHATGDIFWFVHADACPKHGSIAAIAHHIAKGADGGWFRFEFEGVRSKAAEWLAGLINWRAERGIAYGDQGLFFSRSHFERLGGFDAHPLFEEVRLVKAAKRLGTFSSLPVSIGVDPRRWQQTGWIRVTLVNRALAMAHWLGVPPTRLAQWYRGRGRG